MKEIVSSSKMQIYKNLLELPEKDQFLINDAINQLKNAYAPYSEFLVGASVRLANNKVFQGSNQENASYSLTICGERAALFSAATRFPDEPIACLAIVAKNLNKILTQPVTPCGACRQVILEYENRHDQAIRILLKADGPEIYEIESAKTLLPFSFDNSFL